MDFFFARDPFIFTRPWKNSTLSPLSLRFIYVSARHPVAGVPLIEREIPDCREDLSNYREMLPRRVLEASLYPLGLQIFSGFQTGSRYPSFLTLIIDDGVRTWPDTFENVNLSLGRGEIVFYGRVIFFFFFFQF